MRVQEGEDDDDCRENEDDSEDHDLESRRRGPLSKAGMQEAAELGRQTRCSAEEIAKKYGKSVRTVMISVGLAVQTARQIYFSNAYKVWYAHHHPQPEDSKRDFNYFICAL